MAVKSVLGGAPPRPKSPSGKAHLKIFGDKVRVTWVEGYGDGKTYNFTRKELPKLPKIVGDFEDDVYIRLNKDKDEITTIEPQDGMFTVRLVDFTRPNGKDSPPCFVEDEKEQKKYNKAEPVLVFTAHFEILSGEYKGARIFKKLHYKFTQRHDGMTCYTFDIPTAKQKKWRACCELMKFMDIAELGRSDIEWPEDGNILPELLDRAEESPVKFNVVMEDGWITNFLDIKAYSKAEDDVEDGEDVEPANKTKKSEKELKAELGVTDDEDDDM